MHPSRRTAYQWGGLLVLAALATHIHVLWGGWVRDDYALILNNPAVRRLANIPAQLTQPFLGQFWRPSVTISYTLEYALWGLRPAGFHATNLALHCTATLLVFGLWRRFSTAPQLPFFAALLFAVHGAHYQPAVIADRTGLMATAFGLLAWWCATRSADGRGAPRAVGWGAAALAAYVVALGAKEEVVVLPVLMLAVGALQPRPADAPPVWKRLAPIAACLFLLALGYVGLRGRILGDSGLVAIALPGVGARLISMPVWVLHHWRDAVVPLWLDVDYRGAVWPLVRTPRAVMAAVGVAGAVAVAWRARGARPELLVGVVWWLLAWLPTSNLVPVYPETATTHVFMPPHFLYFPNAALVGAIAAVGVWLLASRTRAAWVVVGAFAALHAVQTVRMNYVWMDDVRLYRYVLAQHPRHPLMWRNLGLALLQRGRVEDAAQAYEASIEVQPSAEAWNGLGLVRAQTGESQRAIVAYTRALHLEPLHTNARLNCATLLQSLGRDADAVRLVEEGLAAGADPAPLRRTLALLHREAGRLAQAEAELRTALRSAPEDATVWNTLGTVLADRGGRVGALEAWDRAEALAPGMTPALENRRRFLAR